MAYTELLRLRVVHTYYGDGPGDLVVRPLDPAEFTRAALLLRRDGAEVVVLGPKDDRPADVALLVLGENPALITATRAVIWEDLSITRLTLAKDDWQFGEGQPARIARPLGDQRALGGVKVALASDEGRVVTLRFDSEDVIWVYHVLGSVADRKLAVTDPDGVVSFEDLGHTALPNGMNARVLRARQGIAIRARPTQKFTLQQSEGLRPQTLVPVLPAPALDTLKPFHDAGSSAHLQADIYISLN